MFGALGKDIGESVAESVIKKVRKPFAAAGAARFVSDIPRDALIKWIESHHDEYGEFNYEACADHILTELHKEADRRLKAVIKD